MTDETAVADYVETVEPSAEPPAEMAQEAEPVAGENPAMAQAEAEKPKATRKAKPYHPALEVDDKGVATVKVVSSTSPEGYNPEKFALLRKADFEKEYDYLLWKADHYDRLAFQLRKDADQLKKGGGQKALKKAKQLRAMQDRIAAIKAEIAEEGGDADELLASLEEPEEATSPEVSSSEPKGLTE